MPALRDQWLSDYVIADADDLPTAAGDQWIVLLQDNRPVGAIAPATATPEPAIIVAAADLDLDAALASDAFTDAADVGAVVIVEGQAIIGVWSGPSLANAMMRGPTRGITRSVLPGAPTIPLIVRSCTFTENGIMCVTVLSFASKPFPMPACPNARHLSAHDFNW
jgi:hypothetical protein